MKNCSIRIISIVFIVFAPILVLAQNNYVGVKAGLSIPSISGGNNEVSEGYKSRLGPNFGIFGDFGVSQTFSIQAEINFASQGGKRNGMQPITRSIPGFQLPPGTYLYADFNNETILNYLEIPVMAKFSWGKEWRYYVNAGPYIGFLLSAKSKTSGTSTLYFDKNGTVPVTIQGQPIPPVSLDAETDVKDDINKINVGLTGGGGIARAVGKNYLFLDLRGAYGLTHIQKNASLNGKSHTGSLVISLGFAFRLGK